MASAAERGERARVNILGRSCVKCGGPDFATSYHKPGCSDPGCSCTSQCRYGSHNKQHAAHLHRFCRNCGYDWCDPVASPPDPDTREAGA